MGATFQATKKSKGFCSPESRKFCCQQDIALYGRHRSCSHALYISTNDLHVLGESFPVSKHSSLSLDFFFNLYSANYLLSFGQLFFVGKGRRHLHAPHNLVHSIWFDPLGGIYMAGRCLGDLCGFNGNNAVAWWHYFSLCKASVEYFLRLD